MSKKETAKRIAHMTRYLPEKMNQVRQGHLNKTELQLLKEELLAEKNDLEKYAEDICEYLNRKCIKDVRIPMIKTKEQAANFSYIDGLEACDFMFVEEFCMYSEYNQQRPECVKGKLNTGIGLLYACIYDLTYAITEVQFYIENLEDL